MNKTLLIIAVAPLILQACAASPKTFYANPASVKDTTLCRTFLDAAEAGQDQFAQDTAAEAIKRGLTLEQCQDKVATENAVLAGVAVVAVGAAAIAACSGGGCSGYSAPYSTYGSADYDCWGGGGDGPNYVRGPFRLTGPDIYDLDRDGDGIACEPVTYIGGVVWGSHVRWNHGLAPRGPCIRRQEMTALVLPLRIEFTAERIHTFAATE